MTGTAEVGPGSLVEGLAGEMVARWARGERPPTEDYLARFPDLLRSPAAALELIAEELALRQEYGLPVSEDDLAARFPAWQAQVRALVRCQRVLGPAAAPRFPGAGEALGEFRLVSELGRGAHGRVYLATQPLLGGRPVVVKLAPVAGREHLSLARLQHTHIVPLYSAHEFPGHGLRGLCMPYFGGLTLDRVFAALKAGTGAASGAGLLGVLRESGPGELASPARGPAHEILERAAYPDAVCWVGACLADALQYAHDRGLLHLDVKPSNVLLAADGVPMLLDFHLARPPVRAGDPPPQWLGGTPGYMAPEHAAALEAVGTATAVPGDLDGRADVYSLGVILAEALRGASVPAGLADILACCAAASPSERYPTAAALAADLRRHLSDLPLRGVANRSLAERWRKWRRRRPLALPLVLAFAAAAVAGTGFVVRAERQAGQAESALQGGEAHLRNGRYAEAAEALRGGETLLEGVPFRDELRGRLHETRRAAERGQAAEELHAVCEQVRPLYAAGFVTRSQAEAVGARCRALWARRDLLARTLTGRADPELDARWRNDLLDLGVMVAHLDVISSSADQTTAASRRALDTLGEAERLFGPSTVLDLERVRHARALGLGAVADAAVRRTRTWTPRTAWENVVAGRGALADADHLRAASAFDRALELDPGCFWANYHRGICRLKAGESAEALAAFSACTALSPCSAWCFHNRGLAYAALGRLEQALRDFDRAVTLDDQFGEAYLARAAVHHQAGRHSSALADLRMASGAGCPASAVGYQRAVVLLSLGDRPAAIADLRSCLSADPGHRAARELLDRLAER